MTRDLTSGSPLKTILQFAIPVLLGLLLQQVYSLVDTAIVGHALGVMALGGVGATSSVNFLVIGFSGGLCTGMSIPIAQTFGAGDYRALRRYIGNCVWLSAIASALLLALTLPTCRAMLTAMGTPAEQFEYAFDYIFIIFCGIPATVLYNMGACVLRSLGDSKSPVWFLALASLINIVLDFAAIYGLKMGVAGAAIATVVSQAVSGVLCVWYMKKHFDVLRVEKDDWKFRRAEALRLLGMGVPVGLQFSITAIGSVLLQSAVNSLGATYVSGAAAASKLFQLFCCPYDTLATAATSFTGQNLGAGKYDRIRQGTRACNMIGLIYCCIHILLALFTTRYAIWIFMSADEAQSVLAYTQQMCNFVAFFSPLLLFVNVFRLSIQGMGYSRVALCAGIMEMIARTFVGIWAVPRFGYDAACLAGPFAWLLADAFLIPAYFACLRAREQQAVEAKKLAARE
ncbi:MAG: MATE family efflux transporter [Oscillospiraceae bacterium]|nr:MATE family efflux transporter [Oscillospiraceae bacterium]